MNTFMNQVVNPFMKWLLKSPLHGLVSSHYMLITVKGRKSGKLYTTPVEYGHDGDALLIVEPPQRGVLHAHQAVAARPE